MTSALFDTNSTDSINDWFNAALDTLSSEPGYPKELVHATVVPNTRWLCHAFRMFNADVLKALSQNSAEDGLKVIRALVIDVPHKFGLMNFVATDHPRTYVNFLPEAYRTVHGEIHND